jgi:hypothetical protein
MRKAAENGEQDWTVYNLAMIQQGRMRVMTSSSSSSPPCEQLSGAGDVGNQLQSYAGFVEIASYVEDIRTHVTSNCNLPDVISG